MRVLLLQKVEIFEKSCKKKKTGGPDRARTDAARTRWIRYCKKVLNDLSKKYIRRSMTFNTTVPMYNWFYKQIYGLIQSESFKDQPEAQDNMFMTSEGFSAYCPRVLEYSFLCLFIQSPKQRKQIDFMEMYGIEENLGTLLMQRESDNPSIGEFANQCKYNHFLYPFMVLCYRLVKDDLEAYPNMRTIITKLITKHLIPNDKDETATSE